MTRTVNAVVIGLALLATILPACQAPKKDLTIPLIYRPSSAVDRQVPLTNAPALKLFVEVIDERPDKNKVGENIEEESPRPIFASGPEPAEFLRDAVVRELAGLGMAVVSDKAAANRVLTLHLIKFYCVESAVYDADVRANTEVRGEGRVLWTGLVSGAKRNFGRSLSAVNYQESFSGATSRMVAQMVSSSDFQKAVTVKES